MDNKNSESMQLTPLLGMPSRHTAWARANTAFRNKDYTSALSLYQQAMSTVDEVLKERIRFNLLLTYRRLGIVTPPMTQYLEKPEGLDDYHFNMICQGGFFDLAWYLAQYKVKHQITGNPLGHYLAHGVSLSINPSPYFDTSHYIHTHKDVAETNIHPFIHYVTQGHKEGRTTSPVLVDLGLDVYQMEEPRYVPRLSLDAEPVEKAVRAIAFYLPQFHQIPENDTWWGKGFTEWTNVKPAKPQFDGHYQPHVPDNEVGYYDLTDTTVMRKQIELAKQYGIEGFCFYTYWFSGHRLLETPVDNYLADTTLDLPFCICWANENWSRRWDGLEQDLLMEQVYSPEDDVAFISHMSKYLRDNRYIHTDGKPLLIVYRPNLFPSMKATAERWRDWCRNDGIGEIFIAYVQSFEKLDPAYYGLDAAIEFPPNNSAPPEITKQVPSLSSQFSGNIYDWRIFLKRSENYETSTYPLFRGVCPSWDNTARKKERGTIFVNSSPKLFERWLVSTFEEATVCAEEKDQRFVFINAWNEWAEGAHLEPDRLYGFAWLQAVRNAHQIALAVAKVRVAVAIHCFYPEILEEIMARVSWMRRETTVFYITTTAENEDIVRNTISKYQFKFYITTCANHGRDVLPFLKTLPKILNDGSDIVLKVHTKKSPHRQDGDQWRKDLYDVLLSKSFITETKLALIKGDRIGLSAPSDHVVPMSFYWGSNELNVNNLCERVSCDLSKIEKAEFVAGTMFAASSDMLKSLLSLKLQDSDFEPELGQVDGTMAHAVERMIGVLCYSYGYKFLKYGKNKSESFKYAVAST